MRTLKDKLMARRSPKAHHNEEQEDLYKIGGKSSKVRVKGGQRFGRKWFPQTKAE